MKKLFSIILLGCLVFGLATAASAETKVYFDLLSGSGETKLSEKSYEDGVYDPENSSKIKPSGDLFGGILGMESSLNKFMVGAEYGVASLGNGIIKYNGVRDGRITGNYTIAEVKTGYQVMDQEMFKLGIMMSVLSINLDGKWKDVNDDYVEYKPSMSGNMLGVDFGIDFTKKIALQASVATSLLGASANNTFMGIAATRIDDPSLTEFKLKLNYFINDNWGVNLGYRSYSYSVKARHYYADDDGSTSDDEDDRYKTDENISIITVGAMYKF